MAMRRRRPIDNRRLIAVLVTIACLVAAAWAAIYAASEARERPRVLGRFREPEIIVSQLEPLAVQTDPLTGDVVVIARDERGNLSQVRLPSETGVAAGNLRLPVAPSPAAGSGVGGQGGSPPLPGAPPPTP